MSGVALTTIVIYSGPHQVTIIPTCMTIILTKRITGMLTPATEAMPNIPTCLPEQMVLL
jgi:hypothetical protein